jgi:hypothetical protein
MDENFPQGRGLGALLLALAVSGCALHSPRQGTREPSPRVSAPRPSSQLPRPSTARGYDENVKKSQMSKETEEDEDDEDEEDDEKAMKPQMGKEAEEDGDEDNEEKEPGCKNGEAGNGSESMVDEELHEEEDAFKTDLLNRLLGLMESRLDVFGWVEANYTANPQVRADGMNFLLIPNSQANEFVFQQVYLVFEQRIKYPDRIDCGFRFDNLFGVDAQNFHAAGLLDRTFAPDTFAYDPVQFYGELSLPVGEGLLIRGGRFFALPGYETATAPGRPLLSTSDMFSFGAHPYTQFGVMSTWRPSDRLTLYNGVVNGWDHWIDAHDPWSYAGALSRDSADARTNLTITLNAGFTQFRRVFPAVDRFPPGLSGPYAPAALINNPRLGLRSSDTTLFTEVLSHEFTDALTLIVESDQAIANHLAPLVPVPGRPRTHASYYGLAGWLLYQLTETLTGVARLEVFRDNNGLLTGYSDNFYESTLGLIFKPVPWFWLRPEVRVDWAQFHHPFNIDDSNDRGTNYQFTFGFDALFLF